MNTTTRRLACLAVLLVWPAVTWASDVEAGQKLVGKWEAVERSEGGIGTTLELMADGSMAMSPGTMVDLDYQLTGHRLVVTAPGEGGGAPQVVQTFDIRFDGDKLIQKEVTLGVEMRMVRVGSAPPGCSTIFGAWRSEDEPPADPSMAPELREAAKTVATNAVTIFTPEGKMLLRIPFRRDVGAYQVKGDTLVMKLDKEQTFTYRLEGDSLFLSRHGPADESTFRRVSW